MPHHHGRSGRSMGRKQSGTQSHHGLSQGTTVSSGAAKRQKKAVQVAIDKKGAEDFANYTYQKPTGLAKYNLLAQAFDITGLGKKTHEVNKSYYTKNVIGKINPKTNKPYSANVQEYKDYLAGRGSGEIDAYGRTISKGGNGGPPVKKVVGGQTILAAAPTEAEVSQSDATNAAETKLTKRRVKARGRKMNIYAQSKDKLTLGKKTLLGVV